MIRALALLALLAAPAAAQDLADPQGAAREAAARLAATTAALGRAEEAGGAEARLAALTDTVRAHEEALGLLRAALRAVAGERAALEAALARDGGRTARLLGALQSLGEAPETAPVLHPDGALAAARAGLVLADAAAALGAEAAALRERLEALRALEAAQRDGVAALREGLASVQEARARLAAAAAARGDLPRAYTEDPVATALLIASQETLDAFAANLDATVAERLAAPPDEAARRGDLPLPVAGTVVSGPGEADAQGTARAGVLIATEPRALVTVPVTATLRFRGPLLDYGTVAILEPAPGTLIVLAGLAQVWGEAGQILPEGSPLGLMGGEPAPPEADLSAAPGPDPQVDAQTAAQAGPTGEGGATGEGSTRAPDAVAALADGDALLTAPAGPGAGGRTETLYLEVRDADGPTDPATWFRLGPEGTEN